MYSLYKGDTEIAFGTLEEIANKMNIKVQTVKFYGTPSSKKRYKNGLVLVKCGEEE